MALFALWPSLDPAASEAVRRRLRAAAHIVPALTTECRLGRWDLSVLSTATRFYAPAQQCWHDPETGEACVLHGVAWQARDGRPLLLDAGRIAGLLDAPSRRLPDDVAGEYALLRVFADGQVLALSDPAGLQQLFFTDRDGAAVANRPGFLAALLRERRSDARMLRWLPTIGYRIGARTSYRDVHALPPDRALTLAAGRPALHALPRPVVAFPERRGLSLGAALFEQGIVEAQAAIRLASDGQDRIDLPITGGKDSRAVLALCLSAGLGDRLRLFTRGYEGHPDVAAGRLIAAACGLPHERQAPLGSDTPAHWTLDRFVDRLAAQTFQTDGMVGGWDLILGERLGTGTLITGHMGEVLKAYSKRPAPEGPLDPVAMVRLQAPFDPLGLLRPEALAELRAELQAQMDRARADGAAPDDLPDVFYYRNRIPNWLGAVRAIKSFERQPVAPLGVPALMRLAFLLTPQERKMEVVHHRLVADLAPQLLPLPFALQRWDPRLGCAGSEPITATAGPVFGNWQYSLNHNPRIRTWLIAFLSRHDLSLWQALRRDVLIDHLRHRTFDYFDGIGLLGLTVAAFQEAGLVRTLRLGPDDDAGAAAGPAPAPLEPSAHCALRGHLDAVTGAAQASGDGVFRIGATGTVLLHGWLQASGLPGARLAVRAVCEGRVLATAVADRPRPDLAEAGIGDGAHAFVLPLEAAALPGKDVFEIRLMAFDQDFVLQGGAITVTR